MPMVNTEENDLVNYVEINRLQKSPELMEEVFLMNGHHQRNETVLSG